MAADGIFLIAEDGELTEMSVTPYATESVLQEYLALYPGVLPGRRIDPGNPRRWLLVDREVGVPSDEGGPDVMSLDHLFLDQDGVPTLVEVKRSTNTQIRREVVGQLLEYAANGVRFWPVDRLRARLASRLGGSEAADAQVTALIQSGDVEEFWAGVAENLRMGRIRMVFVADEIPERLRRIVEFLNEQLSTAEVLALEVRQYAGGGHRILVPTLIGGTSLARQVKGQKAAVPFEELVAAAGPEAEQFWQRLRIWVTDRGWDTNPTDAGRKVLDPQGRYVFRFQPAWGALEVDMRVLRDRGEVDLAEQLTKRLDVLSDKTLTRAAPKVPITAVLRQWEEFFDGFLPDFIVAVHGPN
jgi:hypothetical protein